MEIKEKNFTQDEIEMIRIADDKEHLLKNDFIDVFRRIIIDKTENGINKGYFKVYSDEDSLRFLVFMNHSPSIEAVDWFTSEINKYINNTDKETLRLRYAQVSGFSNTLLDRFENYTNLYHYCHHFINRNDINLDTVDMKGLEKRRCTEDMIDSCIEIMEEVFTPFPDPPGSFRQDSERIKREYMSSEKGGAELFYKDNILIGFCGHHCGGFTEVCVKKEYQGKGYGEVFVRSTLQSVYELGYNAELYARYDNTRAIHLYEKAGFKKLYETARVNLVRTN